MLNEHVTQKPCYVIPHESPITCAAASVEVTVAAVLVSVTVAKVVVVV